MKQKIKLLLIIPIFLVSKIVIFSDEIPQSWQVEWENAGLLSGETPTGADNVFPVIAESGSNWSQRVQSAIDKAKLATGNFIIYFYSDTYFYQWIGYGWFKLRPLDF